MLDIFVHIFSNLFKWKYINFESDINCWVYTKTIITINVGA